MSLLGGLTNTLFGGAELPPAPDYIGAAETTAEGNLEAARSATTANRPDEFTPYGSRTWEVDPENPDSWTSTTAFNPESQGIFDTNLATQQRMADLGLAGAEQASDVFNNRFSIDSATPTYSGVEGQLDSYGQRRQQVSDAMLSRVNEDVAQDRDEMRSNLIAQGIPPGSEAWDRAMRPIDRQLTDARQQAELYATQQAGQEYASDIAGRNQQGNEAMADYTTGINTYQQDIQNALLERQTPLNEMNAFRTGSQVQAPNFQNFSNQQFTGGADILGATQANADYALGDYNAQQAGSNALMSGLFSLGSAYAGRP